MSQAQSEAPTSASTSVDEKAFFDLHVNGVGYLNRIREVKPRKGQPFLACSISAMRGEPTDLDYTKFDLRVTGAEAKRIVAMLKPCYLSPLWSHLDRGLMAPLKSRANGATRIAA
jgi:hypothetical protein